MINAGIQARGGALSPERSNCLLGGQDGISDQILHNRLKAEVAGRLRELAGKAISAEQMEIARLKAELAKARMERHPKKSGGVFCEGVAVRYAFIERHRTVCPVATLCRVLDVSASGYRQYRARQTGEAVTCQPGRRIDDMAVLVHIKAIFNEMKVAYGLAVRANSIFAFFRCTCFSVPAAGRDRGKRRHLLTTIASIIVICDVYS